jgi:hypothetical protein
MVFFQTLAQMPRRWENGMTNDQLEEKRKKCAELKRLKARYVAATRKAGRAIWGPGLSSEAFFEADGEVARAAERIKEILQ